MSCLPATIQDVPTPSFLVDIDRVKRNCKAMVDRCGKLGCQLRPHMKTHKTIECADLMTNGTKRCIVVSTLAEAEFFANAGYDDIVYGVEPTASKIDRMKVLCEKLESFHVMIDSDYALQLLRDTPLAKDKAWSVILDVDVGYNRGGSLWDSKAAVELVQKVVDSPSLKFEGLYTHDGHSYHMKGAEQLRKLSNESTDRMLALAARLKAVGIDCRAVGLGSTPSCSHPGDHVAQLTEMHPGNYCFYDAMQAALIGSCTMEDVAVRVATRVIGHYPDRNTLLVDCGFLGLSHDGAGCFPGEAYCLIQDQPNLALFKMTQENGYVKPVSGKLKFEDHPIGSLLYLLPYHSCTTAAMHPVYYIHSADKIVDTWTPCRGW